MICLPVAASIDTTGTVRDDPFKSILWRRFETGDHERLLLNETIHCRNFVGVSLSYDVFKSCCSCYTSSSIDSLTILAWNLISLPVVTSAIIYTWCIHWIEVYRTSYGTKPQLSKFWLTTWLLDETVYNLLVVHLKFRTSTENLKTNKLNQILLLWRFTSWSPTHFYTN